ncbi:MAG: hypothetical protein CL917_02955 [Deltaproteobacteria bacterium]|nr:hypothetical protein [Deltaproteobacteria bacterium]
MKNNQFQQGLMGLPEPERRKYPRIPTDQVLTIAPAGRDQVLAQGRDVSAGGIRFQVTGCEIELGEVLTVTFEIGQEQLTVSGRVAWATETDAWVTDIGFEFDRTDSVSMAKLERITSQYEALAVD